MDRKWLAGGVLALILGGCGSGIETDQGGNGSEGTGAEEVTQAAEEVEQAEGAIEAVDTTIEVLDEEVRNLEVPEQSELSDQALEL